MSSLIARAIPKCKQLFSKKRGLIVCSTHFSNWYWPALYAANYGYKVQVVVRPLDNELLNREMNGILAQRGITVIPRQYAVKRSLKALKNNEAIALQVDQNAAVGGLFIPFFGVKASTMRGVSVLRKMSNSPVIAAHDIRQGKHHQVCYSQELQVPKEEEACLNAIHRYFEPIIEEHKECYFWLHPRWKRRPAGEDSLYAGLKV